MQISARKLSGALAILFSLAGVGLAADSSNESTAIFRFANDDQPSVAAPQHAGASECTSCITGSLAPSSGSASGGCGSCGCGSCGCGSCGCAPSPSTFNSFHELLNGGGECGCESHGGWVAGYEQGIIKPYFHNTPGVPTTANLPPNPINLAAVGGGATSPPDFDYDSSFKGWLGYVNCDGIGARVRYWGFEDGSNAATVFDFPAGGINTVLEGAVKAFTFDAEITERIDACAWNFNFSQGVRYLDYKLSSELSFQTAFRPGNVIPLADMSHNFNGFGPIVGMEANRRIGCSNFSLYADCHFSLVYGQSNVTDTANVLARTREDNAVAISELNMGLEWDHPLHNGAKFFVRGGFDAQYWWGTGNIAFNDGSDMGLFGGVASIGFTR